MAEEPRAPRVPEQARELPAAGQQAPSDVNSSTFLDLTTVTTYSRNVAEPRFTISWRGNVGLSTVRGAEEVQKAAKARNLPSPTPSALIIHRDEQESTTLYGVPTLENHPAYLAIDWTDQNRGMRANFQGILQAKKITIPQGTKMVIKLEHVEHKVHGHCVKLSWPGDCFVPINELGEDEGK